LFEVVHVANTSDEVDTDFVWSGVTTMMGERVTFDTRVISVYVDEHVSDEVARGVPSGQLTLKVRNCAVDTTAIVAVMIGGVWVVARFHHVQSATINTAAVRVEHVSNGVSVVHVR
jgi:hypothetical protein